MLSGLLRTASVLASLIVITSFALFATDEMRDASERTAVAVAGHAAASTVDPSAEEEQAREAAHGKLREAIDDANDALVSPFAQAAPDDAGAWVARLVPGLIALLVYGFGLGFLARFLRGPA